MFFRVTLITVDNSSLSYSFPDFFFFLIQKINFGCTCFDRVGRKSETNNIFLGFVSDLWIFRVTASAKGYLSACTVFFVSDVHQGFFALHSKAFVFGLVHRHCDFDIFIFLAKTSRIRYSTLSD